MGWNFCALPGQSQFNKCGSFWTYSSNKKKDTSLMRTHFRGPVVSKIERFHFITLACHFLSFFFPSFLSLLRSAHTTVLEDALCQTVLSLLSTMHLAIPRASRAAVGGKEEREGRPSNPPPPRMGGSSSERD